MEVARKSIELPLKHVREVSGKKFRSKLISAFNYWLEVPSENEEKIQDIIEMLHNASLLIDDIEDGSTLRRGLPVAHLIFGVPSTINSANYYYFETLKKVFECFPKEKLNAACFIYMQRMLELHEGQGVDIYWRDTQTIPTIEDYKKMISLKTTALFGLALDFLKLFSKKDVELTNLLILIGEYFQIRDDYANLKLKIYADQKKFAEDITEGKFSYPIVDCLQKHPNNKIILSILKMKTESFEIKKYVVDYLERVGSIETTYKEIERLYMEVKKEIKRLGGNPYLEETLKLIDLPEKYENIN